MLGWIFFDWMRGKRPSALGACIGAVVGLVAITPAAGFVTVRESLVIGLAGQRDQQPCRPLEVEVDPRRHARRLPLPRGRRDGRDGRHGDLRQGGRPDLGRDPTFLYHLLALVIVSAFTFFGSLLLYKITDLIIPLRVTPEQEEIGLDLSQHGETALCPVRSCSERSRGRPGPDAWCVRRRRTVVLDDFGALANSGRSCTSMACRRPPDSGADGGLAPPPILTNVRERSCPCGRV